jgi:ParB family chromosome partitioning protein
MTKKALGKGLGSIFKEIGSPVLNTESGDFVHEIPVSEINPNPFQPRREFNEEDIKGLADSISKKGLLQPIILRRHKGKFQIITGERRFRAVRKIGSPTIQAYIRKNVSNSDMMELSLIENLQRVQLSPIEEAQAYQQLINSFGLTHDELAVKLSKSRSVISNTLRLLKLDKKVQDLLLAGKITAGHARAILQHPSSKQLKFAEKIIKEKLNVRKSETQSTKNTSSAEDPNLKAFLDEIKYSLGSKVQIKGTGSRGRIEIFYNSTDELKRLSDIMRLGSSNL